MFPQKPLDENQNPGAKRALDKKYQEEFNKKVKDINRVAFFLRPASVFPVNGLLLTSTGFFPLIFRDGPDIGSHFSGWTLSP
jgi:hypothetical protein